MTVSFAHFKSLRRQATTMATRTRGLTPKDARDQLARQQGYTDWAHLARVVQTPITLESDEAPGT